MSRRPSKRGGGDVNAEPPNLIPIMNLMTILIPFLLLSAVFVKIAVLNSSLPSSASADTLPANQPDQAKKDDKPRLNLTVTITKLGFTIAGSGAVLPGPDPHGPTVPRLADGKLDFATLTAKMVEIKRKFPKEKDVIIIPALGTPENPAPTIEYQTIIDTMDAVRVAPEDVVDSDGDGKPDKILFPGVIFGAGIG